MDTPVWFKSSYSSANGQCVECARTPAGGMAVRDSKRPATPPLAFSRTAWQLFTNTIKNLLSGDAAVVPRLALPERIAAAPPGLRLWLAGDADHTSSYTIAMDSGNTEDFARESNTPDALDIPDIDPTKPHTARIYDYGLGGKNHFAADRELAEKVFAAKPSARIAGRENRKFLGRAVKFLAGEAGVRQFLDIGTGLPTTGNVHEVAQAVAPSSHVVYVDNDPLVLAHARALLTSTPEGRTAYIHADFRDPDAILSAQATRDVLDFSQPVALMIVSLLHFIPDEEKPAEIIATLLDALPSGSYLVASHVTAEHDPGGWEPGLKAYQEAGIKGQIRDSREFAELAFSGLELVPPGIVLVSEWRPDNDGPRPTPAEVSFYGGVARKS